MQTDVDTVEFTRRLVQRFRWIGDQRMSDLPIYHPVLQVEAIDFEKSDEGWLGVLITPWFMNLILFPMEHDTLNDVQIGDRLHVHLPSGEHSFMVGEDEELGRYRFLPLASPMLGYSGQDAARQAARAALHRLLSPMAEQAARPQTEQPIAFAKLQDDAPASADRRSFLRRINPVNTSQG